MSKSCSTEAIDCFGTISAALSAAAGTTTTVDTIEIQPGTYSESTIIAPTKTIILKGIETAKTVLQNTGIRITVPNVTISRLTFAGTGIEGNNAANLAIENNIFWVCGTAISITGTTTGNITNNTFFKNTTAINSSVDFAITNNLFSNNTTALAGVTFSSAMVTYNLFNGNVGSFTISTFPGETNIPSTAAGTNVDPKFVLSNVAPPDMDLHLQEGSGAIDTGLSVDIGAFGGTGADNIPFPVTITALKTASTSTTTATITWSANKAYNVMSSTTPGSYNVVYNLTSGPVTTVNVISPGPGTTIETVSADIPGLTAVTTPPGTPVLNVPEYADGMLILSWSFVPDATGYKVHVLDTVTAIETSTDVGNTLFFIVPGLVNGRDYTVSVSAYAKAIYHFKVNVQDNGGHQSDFSEEKTISIGSATDGDPSAPQTAFPDRIVANPDLPNKGCFIATAAYGYYSAPQVQLLRNFRDRFLTTNRPGQAFVEWYYRYGPIGAAFINDHPWLKPVVRIALLPLIGAAWFMTETSISAKIIVLFLIIMISSLLAGRRSFRSGRSH